MRTSTCADGAVEFDRRIVRGQNRLVDRKSQPRIDPDLVRGSCGRRIRTIRAFTGGRRDSKLLVGCGVERRLVRFRDNLIERRLSGSQHASDIWMAKLALQSKVTVDLQLFNRARARAPGHRKKLGKKNLIALTPIDVQNSRVD